MAEIVPFRSRSHPSRRAGTLCRNGHHRWVIWQNKPFDVKSGRLVTVYRCERCGAERSEAR